MTQTLGITVFYGVNAYVLIYFVKELAIVLGRQFNYDGFKYILPITILDCSTIFCLFLLALGKLSRRQLGAISTVVIFQNLAVGMPVQDIPFLEVVLSLIAIGAFSYLQFMQRKT